MIEYLKTNNNEKRFSIFPIVHQDLWDMYKNAVSQFWTVEEIKLFNDKFDDLKANEKEYLKNILAFFTISDGLVIDNLATNFMNESNVLEASYYYGQQILIEQVHAEMYSLLIDSYIKNDEEKGDLFNSMNTNEAVKVKAEWAMNWIGSASFAERLIAFACVEGISFSSVFGGVFWFKSRNLMPGLCEANDLIIKDETSHYEFAVHVYNNYLKDGFKVSKDRIKEIVLSCFDVEKVFINKSMPDGLKGLTKDMMIQYVQFVTDVVLVDFGCSKEFNVSNPLDYMAKIGLSTKNNFFEKQVGEYSKLEGLKDGESLFNEEF